MYPYTNTWRCGNTVKTIDLAKDTVVIEFTEFEMTALAALVERGQFGIEVNAGDTHSIRRAITSVANEFRSLLGHFDLMAPEEAA